MDKLEPLFEAGKVVRIQKGDPSLYASSWTAAIAEIVGAGETLSIKIVVSKAEVIHFLGAKNIRFDEAANVLHLKVGCHAINIANICHVKVGGAVIESRPKGRDSISVNGNMIEGIFPSGSRFGVGVGGSASAEPDC